MADFNGDGFVDEKDVKMLLDYWLKNEPSVDIAPVGGDGIIDFLDFAVFGRFW